MFAIVERHRRIRCVVQGEVLSLGHDTQNKAPGNKAPGDQPAGTPSPKSGRKSGSDGLDKDRQMGSALRSVYQKTVDEAIPDEFLTLLGKLD